MPVLLDAFKLIHIFFISSYLCTARSCINYNSGESPLTTLVLEAVTYFDIRSILYLELCYFLLIHLFDLKNETKCPLNITRSGTIVMDLTVGHIFFIQVSVLLIYIILYHHLFTQILIICILSTAYCEGEDEFKCSNGQCINRTQRCDNQTDCDNDEVYCYGICRTDQYKCANQQCLDVSKARCDGVAHCRDLSDENGCGKLSYFFSLILVAMNKYS